MAIGNPRKNPVTDEQIITAYRDTLSANKVSKSLGVSVTTIYRVLVANRVPLTGLEHYRKVARKFPEAVAKEIVERYQSGEMASALVKRFGGTHYSVKETIRRAGVEIRLNPAPCSSKEEVQRILEMHADGLSQMRISVALNRSQSLVSRVLRKSGIAPHSTRSLTRHGMWKGGRSKASGYIRVIVDKGDPLACMSDGGGYVLEHRLVMARKLNRPLRREETVHHVNGDRCDNRPENLQLRQGRHGHGVVMCCQECGSHNVAPLKLSDPVV